MTDVSKNRIMSTKWNYELNFSDYCPEFKVSWNEIKEWVISIDSSYVFSCEPSKIDSYTAHYGLQKYIQATYEDNEINVMCQANDHCIITINDKFYNTESDAHENVHKIIKIIKIALSGIVN